MEHLTLVHKINIAVHVAAGSLALIIGLAAIIVSKKKRIHRLMGRIFLVLMSVVILTGLIGVFVFEKYFFAGDNRNEWLPGIFRLPGR